ncbi:MAG: sugar ABC transporter permease [Alphaproteobacteria bacterium]|nr:sugar ABC transporter permease [Alphaproteobacteria bacterium]
MPAAVLARLARLDYTPYAFVAPIVLLLLAISVYPALYAIWLATTDATLLRLARAQFVGAANLVRMAGDPVFLAGIWKTIRWDAVVVLTELGLALPMALFLDLRFRGRGLVRAIVVMPYIIPPAVTALMWIYMFDGSFGVVNDLLVRAGVLAQPVSWLSDPTGAFSITAAAMIWAGTPLMAIILLAVLQTVPKELYEAATVDGANAWHRFRHVSLPQLVPTILFLLLLRTIWMSNHIDMIFIMTRGGPGFSNYTEALYAFMTVQQFEIGYASAVAVALAAILLLASAFYVRHLAASVLNR